jgi:hypothetical protein
LLKIACDPHAGAFIAAVPLLFGFQFRLVVAARYRSETPGADGIVGTIPLGTMGKRKLKHGLYASSEGSLANWLHGGLSSRRHNPSGKFST